MNKTKIVLRKIFTERNPHTTMKHTQYLKLGQKKKLCTILEFPFETTRCHPMEAFFQISSYSREYEYFIYKETNQKVP